MDRYYSERLIKRFGFQKGLDLLNVLTARQLGMIPESRAAHYVRENISFYSKPEGKPVHHGT